MDDGTSQGMRRSAGRRRANGLLDRRQQKLGQFVTVSLILAASLELTGRLLVYGPGVSFNVSRIFTLFALLVFGGSAWYILRQVYNIPRLSAAVLLGTGLVVFSESWGVITGLPFLAEPGGPLWREMLRGALEEGTFVAGMAFLIGSFYISILETERAKTHLAAERQDLVREVAERKRAEDSLREAYAAVEQRVAERTASLTETNQRLHAEIAERQRAEQALRESEQRYRTLAEDAYDGICIIQDGEFVAINSELCTILDYSTDEMLHRPFLAMLHPETAKEASRMFEAFMHGMELPGAYETWLLHRNGSRIVAEISGTLIKHQGAEAGLITLRDITARKEAEDALRESEKRYRTLAEASRDVIYIINRDDVVEYLNSNAAAQLGLDCQVIIGRPRSVLFPPDIVEQQGARLRQVLDTGEPLRVENRAYSRDQEGWQDTFLVPLKDDEGNVVAVMGVSRDITERKQAEEALKESEARYRGLVEGANDLVWRIDLQGCFTFVNSAVKRLAGYDPEELLGKRFEDFLEPRSSEVAAASFERRLSEKLGREGVALELVHRRKDGSVFQGEIVTAPIFDLDGRLLEIQGVTRDITERKHAEEALRESEEKYRALFESSHDALMTLEPPSWSFTSGNQATVDMFRASNEEEFISCAPWNLSPERQPDGRASAEKSKEMIETAVREGSHFFDWTHKRIDDEEFPATVLLTRLEQAGKVFIQATVRDITGLRRTEEEREKLEAQLRQAQKMEGIGQLAGGVAHDFNNLMTVVLGYTEMVLGRLAPDDPCYARLTEVEKAAERAVTLTRQLLAFSRKQVLNPEPLDLNTVAGELAKMMQRVIGEHIDLDVIPGHALAEVHADRGQIEQVLMNLSVNARDAMPDGGRLTIDTSNVLFDAEYSTTHLGATPGRYVLLSVTDSGCGMDAKTMQQIFEPFFTTKEKGSGTGLGLATVYGIVRQHEGTIQVYSELGKGTTFKVYLPAFEQSGAAVEREIPKPVRGGNETILLAEDDEQIRCLAKLILEDAGYSVHEAVDGEETVRLCRERGGAFDLLVLDVVMPKKGGRAVLDEIRTLFPGMRCLFASGYSESATHTNFILERGLRLLQKPYQHDSLLRAVREVLDG